MFEYMAAFDENNPRSSLWVFIRYLYLHDMLKLRQLCKSSSQLVTPSKQAWAIRIGYGIIGDLRA